MYAIRSYYAHIFQLFFEFFGFGFGSGFLNRLGSAVDQIFLGQVRADLIDEKEVVAIEYTAHEEMAEQIIHEIREETFEKFDLTCMHIS